MNQPKIKIPSKTNPVATAPAETSGEAQAPATPAEPAKPVLSAAEKKALFDRAFAYDDAVAQLEAQIENIKKEKSVAVKAVQDACGKGPFQYRGREITISSREGTHFFKDYGKRDLETIDG